VSPALARSRCLRRSLGFALKFFNRMRVIPTIVLADEAQTL
jgi:hypothetical protein